MFKFKILGQISMNDEKYSKFKKRIKKCQKKVKDLKKTKMDEIAELNNEIEQLKNSKKWSKKRWLNSTLRRKT